jgi:hypothetical protein
VDDYTVNVQAGTVTLTCLDSRSEFTVTPPLPLGAFASDTAAATYVTGRNRAAAHLRVGAEPDV